MASKNQLQEYFQKKQQPLPKYITTRNGGVDHLPCFVSNLNLFENVFVGDVCTTKKHAEENVAYKALNYINDNKSVATAYEAPNNFDTVLLIDLENVPRIKGIVFKENVYAIGFMSSNSSVYDMRKEYETTMDLQIINSVIKDAADVLLTFTAGTFVYETKNVFIVIITKDHFASALVDILKYKGVNAVHATHIDDILNYTKN